MINIAVFASGSGTNAQRIIEHFAGHPQVRVVLVLSNKKEARVLERARKLEVPTFVFDRHMFYNTSKIEDMLHEQRVDLIVLAGFLWLIPASLLEAWPARIINIHPALLPKYGGKGMYGMNVHRAVLEAGEKESGITVHLVNEVYDRGRILFQARCRIAEDESPESLAGKVHQLEHAHFPRVIEEYVVQLQPPGK